MTEYFFKYLRDSASEEAELIKESILHGSVISEVDQIRVATLCETLNRIAAIDFEEIDSYYRRDE